MIPMVLILSYGLENAHLFIKKTQTMNAYYHYQHENGKQFVTTACPNMLLANFLLEFKKNSKKTQLLPKIIGRWRFKSIKR